MPNPILPLWEHIPDGEPRVFGDRVYLYGSHDNPLSGEFCDIRLKVWSAPVNDLNNWTCHGDCFHAQADGDHPADVTWHDNGMCYAPDVVEKDGKYYLYVYLFYGKGCVAVSDRPEGPFKLISTYKYDEKAALPRDFCNNGVFVDPGVLVDDDGKVYVYCGYEWSYVVQVDPSDMVTVLPDTYKTDIIPREAPFDFFEACSPRKIGDTYYLIYSPRKGSRLVYATSKSPMGPFEYRGVIVDNGVDYPGGNDHGSICKIGDQWYIFYHRMTNGTIFSRQACAERITILPDGTIPQVEMTSLGFQESLNPYVATPAHHCCVIKGGGMIKYLNPLRTVVAGIQKDSVIGYKYFDFGQDDSATSMELVMELRGTGEAGSVRIILDSDVTGQCIGEAHFSSDDTILRIKTPCITGRHALYFVFDDPRNHISWGGLIDRELVQIETFVFTK